jgi:hypothetical protein
MDMQTRDILRDFGVRPGGPAYYLEGAPPKPGLLGWGFSCAVRWLYHEPNENSPRPPEVKIPTQPKKGWMGHPLFTHSSRCLAGPPAMRLTRRLCAS